jgi:sRNA-binding carbon storage regulator CsrA
MYIVNRKKGEKFRIGDAIVTVLSNQRVKLGVEAPPEVKVERLDDSSLSSEPNDCDKPVSGTDG